jgi:hypothetical protein
MGQPCGGGGGGLGRNSGEYILLVCSPLRFIMFLLDTLVDERIRRRLKY